MRRPANVERLTHADPLRLLEEWLAKYRAPHLPGLPRFCGGAVGYAGYDTVRYVERLDKPPHDDRGLPDLSFAFYDRMVIFDHINKTIAVVAHAHVDPRDPERSYQEACEPRRSAGASDLQQQDADLQVDGHRAGRHGAARVSLELRARRLRGGRREGQGVHQGRRHLSGGAQPAPHDARPRPSPFDIYRTLARGQSQPVHVLS